MSNADRVIGFISWLGITAFISLFIFTASTNFLLILGCIWLGLRFISLLMFLGGYRSVVIRPDGYTINKKNCLVPVTALLGPDINVIRRDLASKVAAATRLDKR